MTRLNWKDRLGDLQMNKKLIRLEKMLAKAYLELNMATNRSEYLEARSKIKFIDGQIQEIYFYS